jgi:undecaprenyl-diphosphatase
MDFIKAVLLGIIEGATEFLPISSAVHLILVDEFLKIFSNQDFTIAFEIIIGFVIILFLALRIFNKKPELKTIERLAVDPKFKKEANA